MGKRKTRNKHLPPRLRLVSGGYYWVPTIQGKQKWFFVGNTLHDALIAYGQREAGRVESAKDMSALVKRFLEDPRKVRAKATQKGYRTWSKQLVAWCGHKRPHEIQAHDAARYLDEHPKRVTAQRQIALLSNLLSYAIRIGWMPGPNPLYGLNKGPTARRKRYLTDGEFDAIVSHADRSLKPFLRVAYLTAARKGDLLRLRWSDVRDDGLHLAIQKTKCRLVIAIDGELKTILQELRSRLVVGMHVFIRRGRPFGDDGVYKRYKKACKAAGVEDATFHDIRRKRLTDIERVHGLQLAQRIAAHTDPRTTQGYVVAPEVRVSLPK